MHCTLDSCHTNLYPFHAFGRSRRDLHLPADLSLAIVLLNLICYMLTSSRRWPPDPKLQIGSSD